MLVHLCDSVILPTFNVKQYVVDHLLDSLEVGFVNDIVGDLVRQHIDEHLLEMIVWEAAAMHGLHLLSGADVPREQVHAGAFGESMQRADSCEGNLHGTAFVIIVQSSPEFESIIGFSTGLSNTVRAELIRDIEAHKSPQMLGGTGRRWECHRSP